MGYFRVQRSGDLRLNLTDLALAKAAFSNPHDVFLIIQSVEAGAATASFFFWDGDQMYGDFPFLEFPFDASLLPVRKTPHTEVSPQESPTIPEPASRAQAVRPGSGGFKRKIWGMLGAICLGALVGIVGAFRFLPAYGTSISARPAANTRYPFVSLGLDVERRHRGDLKVTWNHEIPVVANATTGTLLVQDGATQLQHFPG